MLKLQQFIVKPFKKALRLLKQIHKIL